MFIVYFLSVKLFWLILQTFQCLPRNCRISIETLDTKFSGPMREIIFYISFNCIFSLKVTWMSIFAAGSLFIEKLKYLVHPNCHSKKVERCSCYFLCFEYWLHMFFVFPSLSLSIFNIYFCFPLSLFLYLIYKWDHEL